MAKAFHRAWLHALEDDRSVPAYAMQTARVYADFAASAGERGVHVSFRMLLHCTHQWRNRAAKSVGWLRDNGWLETAEGGNGKRAYYFLRIPAPPPEPVSGELPVRILIPVWPRVPEPVRAPVPRTSTSDRRYLDVVTGEVRSLRRKRFAFTTARISLVYGDQHNSAHHSPEPSRRP